jgi:hypothetical protein
VIYYIGDTGLILSQTTGFDWTSQTGKQVKIRRPDGTFITYTDAAVVVDDAVTGQIHVVTGATDLTLAGHYLMQAKLTISSAIRYGQITDFWVEAAM